MSWFNHVWLRRESWPLWAAAKLLAGKDPDVDELTNPSSPRGRRLQLHEHIYEDLKDAVDGETLPCLGSRTNEYVTTRVRPWDVVQWAKAKGYDVPAELLTIPEAPLLAAAERDEAKSTEKPLTTTERHTLLVIIAALCDNFNVDLKSRDAVSEIVGMTQQLGAAVSDDTVRRVLARVPEAVDARRK